MRKYRSIRTNSILILFACLFIVVMSLPAPVFSFHDLDEEIKEDISELVEMRLLYADSLKRLSEVNYEIKQLRTEIQTQRQVLIDLETKYEQSRQRAISSLRWLNRLGPFSYLEAFFGATSLRDLLRRSEMVASAARGALTSLREIETQWLSRAELREQLDNNKQQLETLERERKHLANISEEIQKIEESVARASGDDWGEIASRIEDVVDLWNENLVTYLSNIESEFIKLVDSDVDLQDVTVSSSLFRTTVTIPERSLNRLLEEHEPLQGVKFSFSTDVVALTVDHLDLRMLGELQVGENGDLLYIIETVQYSGLPIRNERLLDPFNEIRLDLSSFMQGLKPDEISPREDEIEIILNWF